MVLAGIGIDAACRIWHARAHMRMQGAFNARRRMHGGSGRSGKAAFTYVCIHALLYIRMKKSVHTYHNTHLHIDRSRSHYIYTGRVRQDRKGCMSNGAAQPRNSPKVARFQHHSTTISLEGEIQLCTARDFWNVARAVSLHVQEDHQDENADV